MGILRRSMFVFIVSTILADSTQALPRTGKHHKSANALSYYVSDFEANNIEDKVTVYREDRLSRMRDILRLVEDFKEAEVNDEQTVADMSVHSKNIWDIPKVYATRKNQRHGDVKHRRHTKRSVFDSIAHGGGFGSFGKHKLQKLEFTFENLLPYLINDMGRNIRQLPKRIFQK